jgi:hypothetical protein
MIRGVKTKPVARLFGYPPAEAKSDKLEKRALTGPTNTRIRRAKTLVKYYTRSKPY